MGLPVTEPGRPLYAEVIVDIAAGSTDRPFHYIIPDSITNLQPGSLVEVPFGGRRSIGFVVGLTSEADVPAERLRPIHKLLEAEPVLAPDALPLARWMVDRYLCRFVQALRVMLPPVVRRSTVAPRTAWRVKVLMGIRELQELRESQLRRAPRQAQAIDRLLAAMTNGEPGPFWVDDLRTGKGAEGDLSTDALRRLEQRGVLVLERAVRARDPHPPGKFSPSPLHEPNDQQAAALAAIDEAADRGQFTSILLWGVTGSGKTEVYLHAIGRMLERGRGSIVLVPEISLTPQMIQRFKAALGEKVAVLHSGLSAGERYDEWHRIRSGAAPVVVGARSAVFAPVQPLGLIVVDEEHAGSYKQEDAPRYHAREVALERGRLNNAVVVLGSATPSVETVYAARQGVHREIRLANRIGWRPHPEIIVVDMRAEYRRGNRGFFSRELEDAITRHLSNGGQVLLFLNRRGFATVTLCRECGAPVRCPNCSVALTYHRTDGRLHCHYCEYSRRPPDQCPQCGGSAIGFFGAGTQRVEQAAQQQFPRARVARMDADTTRRKGSHERIYHAFRQGEIDILVGTQMIARGWDVPGVTLVGVIDADVALHLPDFRSGERAFELLTQVAGRAGRGDEPGQVYIQTFNPDHYAIKAAAGGDDDAFYQAELVSRRELGYPPYSELVRIVLSGSGDEAVAAEAERVSSLVMEFWAGQDALDDNQLLGPSPAPLHRLRGMYRWHMLLKGPDGKLLRETARQVLASVPDRQGAAVRLAVDANPLSLL